MIDPVEIFDALGIGWGVHELYPNPVEQHAFQSAVGRLEGLAGSSITYEIGAGSVSCSGEALPIERGGTARLSLRLFVHEVEWLELVGAPAPDDLNQFFALLAADEETVRAGGGIAQKLQEADVWSVSVTQRGLLTELLEAPWEQRESDQEYDTGDGGSRATKLARMVASGAKPEEVAAALVEDNDGDPDQIAESFGAAYRVVYPDSDPAGGGAETVPEMLTAYRNAPRTRPPVDTFAEAFFLIPVEAQARILSDFLAHREEGLHSLLLDQFAGVELAELAPHLESDTFAELVRYARDVVESDTGSADELLPLVSAAREVKVARMSAAGRIREMIEGIGGLGGATGGLAGKLRAEIAGVDDLSIHVARSLLEIEERPDRMSRIVEAWGQRISDQVAAGTMERALRLARAGLVEADLSPSKRAAVEAGLVELLRSDFAVFNEAAHDPDRRAEMAELLGLFGQPAAIHLMERLSVEEDPATRRVLISLLVVVGGSFSDPIVRFFKAPEWYVVRNAVAIAGKIGGRKWVPHLGPLLSHADHRVVVETMRALAPLAPDEASAGLVRSLAHEHPRVRETALLLLKDSSSSARVDHLCDALLDPAMDEARDEIAELLFDIGTEQAIGALRQIARKPFIINATGRQARKSARLVLGRAA
ncbi:MAG: hypothetical protein HKN74_04900 [Acidimicrobiia bacterium]|nr:HEAT repeat domain-containing protein [Acidimicrobiia bacterium]MBT8218129.1 HEAT repeat domain-containing protein [Acidimicrobiia bacterium]NNF09604.1 hypothetical protein [Acidimicrobiia bacterium]NNL69797.1 hypothetical protein [Acidimicrobiia bacterium]